MTRPVDGVWPLFSVHITVGPEMGGVEVGTCRHVIRKIIRYSTSVPRLIDRSVLHIPSMHVFSNQVSINKIRTAMNYCLATKEILDKIFS